MSTSIRITGDTVDRTVRPVVVGIAVQLVFQRQTVTVTTIQSKSAEPEKHHLGLRPRGHSYTLPICSNKLCSTNKLHV